MLRVIGQGDRLSAHSEDFSLRQPSRASLDFMRHRPVVDNKSQSTPRVPTAIVTKCSSTLAPSGGLARVDPKRGVAYLAEHPQDVYESRSY
jgi:hypothetical protein